MMEQFYFIITERCNLKCSHCIRDSSPNRNETAEVSMIKNALSQISQSHPDSIVLMTGGEPTLHRHFHELLDFGLRIGLNITINTNGVTTFFKDSTLKELSKHSRLSVQVSLDGDETMHDSIRGPNSYRKALRTLGRLVKNGIRCTVSTTVVDIDFMTRADSFISSLDMIGLAQISIKRATYAGRASSGIDVNGKKWNEHVYRLRSLKTKTLLKISPMYDFNRLDLLPDDPLMSLKLPPSAVNCGAGTAKVYVYTNGDVCPCTCFKDKPMGNLYQSDLNTILSMQQSIQVNHPACNSCRYFRLCRGGCLGSGYQTTGIIGMPDPRCPKVSSWERNVTSIAYFKHF